MVSVLGFLGPYVLCHICSTLPFSCESIHREYINEWAWLFF
jgi:hypothetical protein